uniref:LysM domain-containing protein n=1 Tax=Acrobeloides nanus TaxID=290746 RepID=A0A914DJ07_9BILA
MIILINMALASLDEPEKVTMMDAIVFYHFYTQTIIKRSIAEFQETAGLPKTGNLDIKTKEMFTAPRCAFTDFHAQSEFDVKWEKNDLVYTILNYSPDLTRVEIREAIAAAFAKWSAVIPLNFKEVDQDGDHIDINIGFYRKRHGDNDPFDGEGARITASPQTSEPKEKPFTRNGFYAARRGDTAKTIADVFDISIDDLKTFNPQLNINKINPGKWIRVIEDRKPDLQQLLYLQQKLNNLSQPLLNLQQNLHNLSQPLLYL